MRHQDLETPVPSHHCSRRRVRQCSRRWHGAPSRPVGVDRYYDPQTGQFLSVDPMVQATQQAYIYAGDDPVDGTDPNGLYNYTYRHNLGKKKFLGNAAQVMSDFRSEFKRVFPFVITGCSSLVNGAKCVLHAGPSWWPIHGVGVATVHIDSPTEFQFTVSRKGYFDPVGSRITFNTYNSGGDVWLAQHGYAPKNHGLLNRLAPLVAGLEWDQQAQNLADLAFSIKSPGLDPFAYGYQPWNISSPPTSGLG